MGQRAKTAVALAFNPAKEQVKVGGRGFTVTALPCGTARKRLMPLAKRLQEGETVADAKLFSEMIGLCHESLAAADPSITLDAMENGLGMADLGELFLEVLRVSIAPRSA